MNSLSVDWVRYIAEDSYGLVWIGTSYGLNTYDPVKRQFTQYINKSSDTPVLSNSFITYIFEDSKKDLWIGTAEGLYKFLRRSNSFKRYSLNEGLSSGIVAAIQEDEDRNLWITTNNGLAQMNPQGKFTNYFIEDGLISNSFINNSTFAKESMFYFGTSDGLVYFYPKDIKNEYLESPVVFTGLKIFNQEIAPNQLFNARVVYQQQLRYVSQLEVKKEENVLTFDLSALTYSYPEKSRDCIQTHWL